MVYSIDISVQLNIVLQQIKSFNCSPVSTRSKDTSIKAVFFLYKGHSVVFDDLRDKQFVCCQTQRYI